MLQDIRQAFRLFAKNPGFTAIAALSLAIGIGANSAIFSLADALLLRPLPVLRPSGVVSISTNTPDNPFGGTSFPDYRDFREKSRSFDGIVAFEFCNFAQRATADASGIPGQRQLFRRSGRAPVHRPRLSPG